MGKSAVGSSFDDFLKDDECLDEVDEIAIKRVLSWQLREEISRLNITKSQLAEEMHTSRAALDRLLDPANTSFTFHTLFRMAAALGKTVRLELVDKPPRKTA